ncbi:hypothetical protein F503_02554 [Ophiostoma piceae UAMH 11346]|uniref:Acyltransferase 3 domain-containing protein n=1 Tax=Ophiostoma piceae (strain UAMH 11346) TaxID=1262450 RepID=S3C3R3_OPHP1|nr:hypothetical protein F503_02554 [Ophiostoma piceae UAMH 11346]
MTHNAGILDGSPEPSALSKNIISKTYNKLFYIENPTSKRLRPTAYLDGLRGFMALLVYVHHHQLWAHGAGPIPLNAVFENGYGYKDQRHFATLPFVRNFFTGGHMAVAVFFVISGYVLAAKPLSLIYDKDYPRLLDSLASSMFRRWFRLYIPIFVTTLVYVITWHFPGYTVSNCDQQSNLRDELWNWYAECKNLSFIYKEGAIWLTFNVHVWSIPLEMRGSLVTFTALLALHRAGARMRLLCTAILTWYSLYVADAYYCALFCAGILLCDLDILHARSSPEYPQFLTRLGKYKTVLSIIFFVLGMYFAGVPSHNNDVNNLRLSPGWGWVSTWKAQAVYDYKWFYLFYASVFMVASIPNLPIKGFFETKFCQYLGRISYALYLVHGPILSSIGDRVYYAFGWVRLESDESMEYWMHWFSLARSGPMGLELSFLVPHLILVPLTFGMANFVTKYVDDYAVSLSANLYKYVVSSGDPTPAPASDRHIA